MKEIDKKIEVLAKRIKNKKNFNQKVGILILFFSDWKAKENKIFFLDFFKTIIDTYCLQFLKKM